MHCNEECPCSAWATAIAPCSPMLQSEIRATTSVTHRQINTHRATTSAMHTQHRVVESRTERKTGQCGINDAIILWSLRFCIDVRPWSISARTIAPLSFKKQPSSCTGSAKQHAALISVITHQASQVPYSTAQAFHTPPKSMLCNTEWSSSAPASVVIASFPISHTKQEINYKTSTVT